MRGRQAGQVERLRGKRRKWNKGRKEGRVNVLGRQPHCQHLHRPLHLHSPQGGMVTRPASFIDARRVECLPLDPGSVFPL